VRHDLTSLPARDRGQQDDSHNDWTYETGSAHFDRGVLLVGEEDAEVFFLAVGQQAHPGVEGAAQLRPAEWCTNPAAR
ncbi:hypothetical protein ACIQ00_11350, partial [Micrococcus luteus]